MTTSEDTDRKLAASLATQLLTARRVEGDRLMLADEVLLAALDGRRPLSANERGALVASPVTLRRFRTLSAGRRHTAPAANDAWEGSYGMLRAAASAAPVDTMATDDGHWALHFVGGEGGWRVILAVDGGAPFAARLMREQPMLRVVDGAGGLVLQGSLDADGECESAWPFEQGPGPHFQACGARFGVEPVAAGGPAKG